MGRMFRSLVQIIVLALLMGFIVGAALAISDLKEFSLVPSILPFLLAVLAGGFIGALTSELSQALVTLLLVLLISPVVSVLALTYPELRVDRLGLEIALELSIVKSLQNVVVTAPLIIVGLLLGKFLARSA